jgi:hypothetical protein
MTRQNLVSVSITSFVQMISPPSSGGFTYCVCDTLLCRMQRLMLLHFDAVHMAVLLVMELLNFLTKLCPSWATTIISPSCESQT